MKARTWEERARAAEAALRELVALKDMKDEEARLRQRRIVSIERDIEARFEVDKMRDEYNRRKPAAWDAARRVLAETSCEHCAAPNGTHFACCPSLCTNCKATDWKHYCSCPYATPQNRIVGGE